MYRKHTVICTAGHIDHGKSSLIESLTGQHPDVLREEQEREMTIDLGFVFYRDDVTFIDVPGHEKFLKTMLAGASGVDGAVLVIAADDGVMPQTREHFEILQLMGVRDGIIALTKTDLADKDWIDLVREEISGLVKGTFLENAPIVPVSNRSGDGIDDLRNALDKLIDSAPSRKDRGLFRMWLDRAFTIKGSGTVVAGTVLSGTAKINDRVEILPAGIIARIKRIQVHKVDVPLSRIGERAALNLPGVDKDQVKRGDLLASQGHYRPTFMMNARLLHLSSLNRPIENRLRIRLHLGSSEIIGRIILLEKKPVPAGGSALVQFRLENQAMADIGDRFVIRGFSDGRVLGGGSILETHPGKMRQAGENEIKRLNRLESAEPAEIVRQYLQKAGERGADAAGISSGTAILKTDVVSIIGAMERDGEVVVIDFEPKWNVVIADRYTSLRESLLAYLDEFHNAKPELQGARRSDIRAKLMPKAATWVLDYILTDLSNDGKIELMGETIRLTGFRISLSTDQDNLKNEISELFLQNLFKPPSPEELSDLLNEKPKTIEPVFTAMVQLGILLKLNTPEGKPIYYHSEAVSAAKHHLLEFFKTNNEMKFFEFRQLIDSTRKFTTPILMYFDDHGLTLRKGEVRVLRKQVE